MIESKDSVVIARKILSLLEKTNAIGEIKLKDLVLSNDNGDDTDYLLALRQLYKSKVIEVVSDPLETMNVVRLIQVLH